MLSAVHDIPMDQVARAAGLTPKFGQSPFAITRGKVFEASLYASEAERLREALIKSGVLPPGADGFEDYRLTMNGGKVKTLDAALAKTEAFLRRAATAGAKARDALPTIVAGPTLRIPGRAILPDGMFAIDVMTVHPQASPRPVVLRVGEIKVYPDRGGFTDPGELSSTRAQAGIYVHALQLAIHEMKLGGGVEVALDGFLVLSRPGSNFPSIRAREDLRWQAQRAETGFERLRQAASVALPLDSGSEDAPKARLKVVQSAERQYDERCVSFCELAEECQRLAKEAGDPAILGHDVARFLGTITLHRAAQLMDGAKPKSPAEADLARRMKELELA